MSAVKVSIIIPVLNEAGRITGLLQQLQPARMSGHELVVVDGGSTDGTVENAVDLADRVILAAQGRAQQMRTGVRYASGDVYWFLHADASFDEGLLPAMLEWVGSPQHAWGFFRVRMQSDRPALLLVTAMMNIRSGLTQIATGDQGIFISKQLYASSGGYRAIELMEDIDISKRAKKLSRPFIGDATLLVSPRKWEKEGVLKTILLMWRLRFLFWFGADSARLAEIYYRQR